MGWLYGPTLKLLYLKLISFSDILARLNSALANTIRIN